MEYLFPEYRLDWFGAGPSSPNKTGALLAILFVAAWWPALRFRWGFWLSLPIAFVAAVFMLQTESRGAIVAAGTSVVLLAGLGACQMMVVDRLKTLKGRLISNSFLSRALSLVVALIVLVFYSQQLGVNDRMVAITSGEDGSSNVRVALYSAGLQIIAAAPEGWGSGAAGDAYGQWYQEIGDSRSYLSLVNSHLTWMVDYGMLFQFLYITAWAYVFMFCWPVPWTPLKGVATGCWLALSICGFFSSVLTLIWLWALPVLLFLFVLIQRYRMHDCPKKSHCLITGSSVLLAMVALLVTAHAFNGPVAISASPDLIEVGARPKAILVVEPDRQILGDKYGHTIRESLDVLAGYTILKDSAQLGRLAIREYDSIVFSGQVPRLSLDGFVGQIFLFNPNVEAAESIGAFRELGVQVILGSLGDWRRLRVWETIAEENQNWDLVELRGVAEFIPNWPQYLISKIDK